MEPLANWFTEQKEKVERKITTGHDRIMEESTRKVLAAAGPRLFRFIEDPYLPEPLKSWTRATYDRVWSEIEEELTHSTVASFGWSDVHLAARESRLERWPTRPNLFKCCHPRYSCFSAIIHLGRALRARFLYADQPADGSAWKVLRDPLGLLIFALKMHVTTSVGTFALLFLLMDKRDEAQLIYFILRVKSTMFVVAGLYPAAMLGISTHSCLIAVDEGHPQQCINEAASSQAAFAVQFCFELMRLLLIVLAFLLLVCGYAVGGDEEIAALEYQRLHNSTPPPPPSSHHHSSSSKAAEEEEEGRGGGGGSGAGAASSASDKPSRPPPPPPLANAPPMASPRMGDPSIIQKHLDEQRDKMGAAPAFGGNRNYSISLANPPSPPQPPTSLSPLPCTQAPFPTSSLMTFSC